jgi:hypothetical protein
MKKLSNLASLIRELLHIISYVVLIYAGSKVLSNDSAEIKIKRNKIKRLLEKRNRLQNKNKKKSIEKEINDIVPEDKVKHFNDLLSKL